MDNPEKLIMHLHNTFHSDYWREIKWRIITADTTICKGTNMMESIILLTK